MQNTLAVSVKEAASIIGLGQTKTWQHIASGALPARKVGGRTLVLVKDLHDFLEAAPPARSAKAA